MKLRPRLLLRALSIITVVFVGGLFLVSHQPVTASNQALTTVPMGVAQSQEVVVRLYYNEQTQLDAVAGRLDIWEVHQTPEAGAGSGYAVVAVNLVQQEWLQSQGYRLELDPQLTAQLQSPAAVLDPRYYYFDSFFNNTNNRYMVDFLQSINASYPGLTELLDVGDAWLAGHTGYHRDIWVLRISNEDPQYGAILSKPAFFMMANIHAREVTTPEMAIRYIKYLTGGYNGQGGYGINPDVTWLVNHHATYVLVSVNPDGRVNNEQNTGAYWRKNVDRDDGCTDSSSWGVDINRNSNFYWASGGGSSGYPCDETYRGPAPSSEPETLAFQSFAETIFQDWNGNNGDNDIVASPDNASGIFITLHSYADDVLWPFGFAPGTSPNNAQLSTIGHKLADLTTYMNPTGYVGYPTDGTSDDWIYGHLGVAAFTYEIGPEPYGNPCGGFFPSYGCQDGIDGMPRNFWNDLKASFIYANKIAATPYITAYGPDAQNLVVTPSAVPGGVPVNLTGTVIDQRYAGEPTIPVAAAEYFIDAPGEDGAGFAMSPSDGNWGGVSEAVQATVDTSGLLEGQHYILVHGKNTNGVWGPFTAIFLHISTPSYGVMLTPATADAQANPGQTVTYQLQVSNVGLNSDAYYIAVQSQWEYTAPSSIGLLNPGESTTIEVSVTIPAGATHGESDVATVTATSQFNPEVHSHSTLTTTANLYNLSLIPAAAAAYGYPGGQVSYVLSLVNQGNITDTFDISAGGTWPVSAPTTLGPLAAGASDDFNVTVSIPSAASAGEFDVTTITATSQGDTTKTQASALTTTAATAGPLLNPATDEASGNPGTQVVYQLQLTNHNYLPDSFTLSASSAWSIEYPASVGPIPANGSTSFQVTVDVPADAAGGASDTALITVTSSIPDLPVATATLITSAKNIYSFQVNPLANPLTGYGTGTLVEYSLIITNTGNNSDSYNFHVLSTDWVVDAPATVGPVARGASVSVSITILVPLDISMGDFNLSTLAVISKANSTGQLVHLRTNTFWYSFYVPISQKH